MSHLVSYKWFKRKLYITSIGLFYKEVGILVVGVFGGYLFYRGSLFYLYSIHNLV